MSDAERDLLCAENAQLRRVIADWIAPGDPGWLDARAAMEGNVTKLSDAAPGPRLTKPSKVDRVLDAARVVEREWGQIRSAIDPAVRELMDSIRAHDAPEPRWTIAWFDLGTDWWQVLDRGKRWLGPMEIEKAGLIVAALNAAEAKP